MLLALQGPIGEASLPVREDRLCEGVTHLTLVQPCLAAASLGWAFQPIEREQGSLYPSNFGEGEVEAVLPLVGREGGSAGVGVVLSRLQAASMEEQTVQNIGGLARGCGDEPRVE